MKTKREQLKSHDFKEIDFIEPLPTKFIGYLKSFYKADLYGNKPLHL